MDQPSISGRNAAGQFVTGNIYGKAGRPQGSRNKATIAAATLLEGQAQALTAKAIDSALSGDTNALKLCLDRLIPATKDRPISIVLPPMTSAAGISDAAEIVLQAVSGGEITPSEGNKFLMLIELRRKALETQELEHRIQQIEQARERKL